MRLFIAFDVPEEVSESLFAVQKALDFDGKSTKPKEFHLTLKFFGEVDEEKLSILIDGLSGITFKSFEAQLSEVGVFPDKNDPKVVWAGLRPHDAICVLQQQVDTAMQKLGFEPDKRFHPHLTLARIKFIKDKAEFSEMLDSLKLEPLKFTVGSLKLFKSTLTPEGPVYDVLREFSAQQ
ncbi:MAG: RNA 2',3'-cyclic phosphodiesterase [Candidatus Woesearchaeota archaeon]